MMGERQLKISSNLLFCCHCCCLVTKLFLILWDPVDCSLPDSSVYGISQQEYWSGLPFLSPRDLPDSLQPHGLYSPWNPPDQTTGVGSLSLLQRIFQTQGSNPVLPHCRQILYQLSQIQPFFLDLHFPDCCKPLASFDFWKSQFWPFLPIFFLLFMRERISENLTLPFSLIPLLPSILCAV